MNNLILTYTVNQKLSFELSLSLIKAYPHISADLWQSNDYIMSFLPYKSGLSQAVRKGNKAHNSSTPAFFFSPLVSSILLCLPGHSPDPIWANSVCLLNTPLPQKERERHLDRVQKGAPNARAVHLALPACQTDTQRVCKRAWVKTQILAVSLLRVHIEWLYIIHIALV